MIVYRLTSYRFSGDLSGRGAELYGGRWNSKGVVALYTCQHRSLCLLELLVHTNAETAPLDLEMMEISIPDSAQIRIIKPNELPENWNNYPYGDFTSQIGDKILNDGKYPVFRVPSAIVEQEYNFIINPKHPDIKKANIISTEPINLDERFFGQ